jgi:hypothetical protein
VTTTNKKLDNIIKKYELPDFPNIFKKDKVQKIAMDYSIAVGKKILTDFNKKLKENNFYSEEEFKEAFSHFAFGGPSEHPYNDEELQEQFLKFKQKILSNRKKTK